MYNISLSIHPILCHKVQTPRLLQLYADLFDISPQFYNLQQATQHHYHHHLLITHFVNAHQKHRQIHLVLTGASSTHLMQEAHHAVNIREIAQEQQRGSITNITSTGFSSVLAFLLCLNIDKKDIFNEVVGLQTLVKTNQPRSD